MKNLDTKPCNQKEFALQHYGIATTCTDPVFVKSVKKNQKKTQKSGPFCANCLTSKTIWRKG